MDRRLYRSRTDRVLAVCAVGSVNISRLNRTWFESFLC